MVAVKQKTKKMGKEQLIMLKAIINLTMSSKTKHKTIVLTNIKIMTPTKHMAHVKESILLAVSGSLTMKKF